MRISPVFGRTEIAVVRPTEKVVRAKRPDDEHNRVGEDEAEPRERRRRPRQVVAVHSAASQSSNAVLSALIELQEQPPAAADQRFGDRDNDENA